MTLLHQIFNTETNAFELRPISVSGSMPVLSNNSGETISLGDLVTMSQVTANSILRASSASLTLCEGIVGVAAGNILDGNSGEILSSGAIKVNADSPLLIGKRVYASVAGRVTSVAPTSGVVYLVGIASDVDRIIFQPHLEAVL
jgi:hypothetical protein